MAIHILGWLLMKGIKLTLGEKFAVSLALQLRPGVEGDNLGTYILSAIINCILIARGVLPKSSADRNYKNYKSPPGHCCQRISSRFSGYHLLLTVIDKGKNKH